MCFGDGSDERKRDERERLYGSGGESPEEPTRRRFWLGKLWPLPATTALLRPGWSAHEDIDMAYQGDVEIIHNWREEHSIEDLQRIVERKGYSAISVGSFDHAALKKFPYQLTAGHCAPSQGYTNTLYIWSGGGAAAAEILDGHVMVHPVDYWGNEKKEQKSDGSEVSMKRKVSRRICIGGALDSIEEVNRMRKETKSAITACKRIGAKGEEAALNDVKNELETGRKDKGVRDVVHEI